MEVQLLMQEELQSLNKLNRSLNLGFTQEEVDEALVGFEEMEKELMEGPGVNIKLSFIDNNVWFNLMKI